jgi:CheY-like chemotaxis protein
MVQEVFGQLGKENWEIYQATDAQGALGTLHEKPVDLVVLDLLMPGISGMDLLKSIERDFPYLQKVFLTGGADEKARISGLEGGADLFLEKPANLAGLESVFATLNQLARWQHKTGARGGALRPAGLLDMIRMECASGNSRLFDVWFENVKGQIYVKAGTIVHAETEGRRGQSAFSFLAARRDAEFSLKQFVEPPERSVDRQWEFLVMEASHVLEQAQKSAEKKPKRTTPEAEGDAEPAISIPETPAAPASPRPAKPVELVRPVLPQPPLPRPTSQPAAIPAPGLPAPASVPVAAAPSAPAPAQPAPAAPITPQTAPASIQLGAQVRPGEVRVEETLVASKQREVLYEAGLTESEARLRLISFFSQRCTEASQGLPSGKLVGAELQASDCRYILRFNENTDVLVRTNTAERRTPATSRPKATPEKWHEAIMEAKGVLASGIVRPDLSVRNLPCYTDYTEQHLNAVWRWCGELFRMLNQDRITAWQLRGIFEKAQLYCVKRLDRFVFGVFVTLDPQEIDANRVQEIFADFDNLGSL